MSHFPWTSHQESWSLPHLSLRSQVVRTVPSWGWGYRELSVECPGNWNTDVQKAHPGSKETTYLLMISMNKIQIEDC